MEATITLIVTRGPLAGRKFAFSDPTTCTIGRSRDCTIALPLEVEHLDVSRRHCVVEMAPPSLRIRDLGSLNGTFINGNKIGQRTTREDCPNPSDFSPPVVNLNDGDEIQLGEHTAFRVRVFPAGERADSASKPRRSSGELRISKPIPS